MITTYKHFKISCNDCNKVLNKEYLLSTSDIDEDLHVLKSDSDIVCDFCNNQKDFSVHVDEKKSSSSRYDVNINFRENWEKKVPKEFSSWLRNDFKKRHGRDTTL